MVGALSSIDDGAGVTWVGSFSDESERSPGLASAGGAAGNPGFTRTFGRGPLDRVDPPFAEGAGVTVVASASSLPESSFRWKKKT